MGQEMSLGKPTTRRCSEAEKDRARRCERLGIGTESLLSWVRRAEVDDGVKPGVTWAQAARVKELEQEVLRRANEVLRWASVYFAQVELGRPWK